MAGSGEVQIINVSKHFGDLAAVDDVSLTIKDGSYCCLLGPSGCGKTTLLRMISGHETPTHGEITIGGDIINAKPPGTRGTAMMFQSYALFPHLQVVDNVAFSLQMKGIGEEERREKAMDVLGNKEAGISAMPDVKCIRTTTSNDSQSHGFRRQVARVYKVPTHHPPTIKATIKVFKIYSNKIR